MAIRLVIRGSIQASAASPADLAAEAVWALDHPHNVPWDSFNSDPDEEPEPDWSASTGLPASGLVSALTHPLWTVRSVAARLLAAGAGGPESQRLLADLLSGNDPDALYLIAAIAETVWKDRAGEQIVNRLEQGVTLASSELFPAALVDSEPNSIARGRAILMEALLHERAAVAERAAGAIEDSGVLDAESELPRVRAALQHWTNRGTDCDEHGGEFFGGACPVCHTVVSQPLAAIARVLAGKHAIEFSEALAVLRAGSRGAREIGVDAMIQLAADDATLLGRALQLILDNEVPIDVLDGLLALPSERLAPVRDKLIEVCGHQSVTLRSRMIGVLADADWLDPAQARQLAEAALYDGAPSVRDRALDALRSLSRA